MANTHHFVTANRLDDGSVVYLDGTRAWVASFTDAAALDAAGSADAVAWAKTRERDVCGPYAFEAEQLADGGWKLSARERFRRDGSSAARARLGY